LPRPPLDLAGRTRLGALAALLSGARLLVCNHSGVSHLASALDVPTVCISADSEPTLRLPINRDRHRVLSCLEGVPPREVLVQAERLLRRPSAPAQSGPVPTPPWRTSPGTRPFAATAVAGS
jgi:ADP-heptose:LPS heptosyltransferase